MLTFFRQRWYMQEKFPFLARLSLVLEDKGMGRGGTGYVTDLV